MTRKELQQIRENYRDLARKCMESRSPYAQIYGVCSSIAQEMCYNHHERGQRIWAFFKALEEVAK